MIKSIVPGLITFDTNLNSLKGFYFTTNLDFFPFSHQRSKFHYGIIIDNKLQIPEKYDFHNAYYKKYLGNWFYERPLKITSLKFSLLTEKKPLFLIMLCLWFLLRLEAYFRLENILQIL